MCLAWQVLWLAFIKVAAVITLTSLYKKYPILNETFKHC